MDAEAIRELFEPSGPIAVKRMFGGHGVHRDGRMIALEADGMIWLKADAQSQAAFEAAGSQPFTYAKKTGPVTITSYWRLPEAAFDDPDEMRRWVRLAEAAAMRAGAKARPRKPHG